MGGMRGGMEEQRGRWSPVTFGPRGGRNNTSILTNEEGRAPNRGGQQPPMGPGIDLQQLNAAPPQQQKQMLGEALYPKIHNQQPELAGKITGMLLEMDNAELLGLTSDDDALRAKVDEAMAVYDEYVKNSQGSGEDGQGQQQQPNGTENHQPGVEEVKDAEA